MPPVVQTCRSDTRISGPATQPRATASRTPASAPHASRTVVTPRLSNVASTGTADNARAERGSSAIPVPQTWVWQSMNPGTSRDPA